MPPVMLPVVVAALGAATPVAAEQLQVDRDAVLFGWSPDSVAHNRALCATGDAGGMLDRLRRAGFATLSVGAYCVTILTRAGRDAALRYVTLANGETTSAIAFDAAFVSAYLKAAPLPANLPGMATVLPVADRCLARQEVSLRLCGLVGQVLGARAAMGELVPVL